MAHYPTIADVSASLASKQTTSRKLVDAAIAAIDDPAGQGAKTFIRRNDARAHAMADASDLMRGVGQVRSPLEGIPISVKDLFDLADEVTTAGSVANNHSAPATADAPVVQALARAGAVITGRTNMSEFAFSGLGLNPHYGTPLNAYDRSTGRIPGGSSSGAAVSVTDGMAFAAIGTDTGGSIRIPAAFCGLTGFKPTARRVSRKSVLPLSTSLDSIGPIAASVACCALIDAIISGETHRSIQSMPLAGLRLAVPQTVVLNDMDDHVAASFAAVLSLLSQGGAHIVEIDVPEFEHLATINAKGGLVAAEAWHWHRKLLESRGDAYDQRVRSRILRGRDMSAADYLDVLEARSAWQTSVNEKLAAFDAILLPTVPIIAPAVAPLEADNDTFFAVNGLVLRNSSVINFLDGCGLSLPCHAAGSAPVGLMIAGGALTDARILSVGLAIEHALKNRAS
ncbi:aspartyl-tRNA(Asn)/glutamyl-tRNA(Gln) amidotransferase subunit A [Rhizobium skierniewicense]|uniref:Aspartyl-tRNA(Asn)/glutamyl-tRNA(Gln) amidotransferase subunit A n=1 Tax=Rhizobium skierniewicense TaxID=984260 RepID=A0A7W6C1V9_9HYPH|nr:amidase [Rhizobium skierniewicense]MBB3944213.1 aspartyl-tRNA(Asn)/glutamyl-tRNA(Gln) amidotransferase subunit A [Rhizobium skierniewicense]